MKVVCCLLGDSIQIKSGFGVFVLWWAQRKLGASVGGCMVTGSVLGGGRKKRVEVWPKGLWIQLSVDVLLGMEC